MKIALIQGSSTKDKNSLLYNSIQKVAKSNGNMEKIIS